ncbi:MAG: DHHA1 domain-containing protein [Minisyncoccia bacterium]|jgi:oligoribonuclease NrnB/cAMP/cGMP phosphodiesterase (DHH superfamily)
MNKKIFVFYHANCPDGFSSAWIFRKKFKDQAQYFDFNYHRNISLEVKNGEIYFVDVSPKEETIKKLSQNNNRLILVDHHISSKGKLPLFNEVVFDINHSAAVLSWFYLFPNKKIPLLFKYIEDIDLWKFKLPYSHELNCVVDNYDFTFENWDKLVKWFDNKKKVKDLVKTGKIIWKYKNKLVRDIAKKAELVEFEKEKVMVVNSSVLISEVGNYLLTQHNIPYSIVWHKANKKILVSLRANGKLDVSKIAEKYHGGGHKNASGFVLEDLNKIPWKNI